MKQKDLCEGCELFKIFKSKCWYWWKGKKMCGQANVRIDNSEELTYITIDGEMRMVRI